MYPCCQRTREEGHRPRCYSGRIRRIAKAHGVECWFCGKSDYTRKGKLICTEEHLLNRDRSDSFDIENLRLAHAVCNNLVGDARLWVKFQVRLMMRTDPGFRDFIMTDAGRKNAFRMIGRMRREMTPRMDGRSPYDLMV